MLLEGRNALVTDMAIEDFNARVPLGRIAQPEDIAGVVVLLASDRARHMSAALDDVNGGKAGG